MGDKDNGLVVRRQDVLQQLALCFWVEGTRGLIKEHNAAVAQQATGYGYALCLSLTQSSTLFATKRIQALRKFCHKVGTALMQSLHHLLI